VGRQADLRAGAAFRSRRERRAAAPALRERLHDGKPEPCSGGRSLAGAPAREPFEQRLLLALRKAWAVVEDGEVCLLALSPELDRDGAARQ
jgi:hypothetical protein